MEIKDFVRETLIPIISGVEEAQAATKVDDTYKGEDNRKTIESDIA